MPRNPAIFGISMASKTSRRWLVLCLTGFHLSIVADVDLA